MAITKDVIIDGQTVQFRASAAVPRMYRLKFGRDIYQDMAALNASFTDSGEMGTAALEIFENIAYIFAKHADPQTVPDTPDEWLENFSMFSIYEVLPELVELWGLNTKETVTGKKRTARPAEK